MRANIMAWMDETVQEVASSMDTQGSPLPAIDMPEVCGFAQRSTDALLGIVAEWSAVPGMQRTLASAVQHLFACMPVVVGLLEALRDLRPELLGDGIIRIIEYAPAVEERMFRVGARSLMSLCRPQRLRFCLVLVGSRRAAADVRISAAATLMSAYIGWGCSADPSTSRWCSTIREAVAACCTAHRAHTCASWLATFPALREPPPTSAVGEVSRSMRMLITRRSLMAFAQPGAKPVGIVVVARCVGAVVRSLLGWAEALLAITLADPQVLSDSARRLRESWRDGGADAVSELGLQDSCAGLLDSESAHLLLKDCDVSGQGER